MMLQSAPSFAGGRIHPAAHSLLPRFSRRSLLASRVAMGDLVADASLDCSPMDPACMQRRDAAQYQLRANGYAETCNAQWDTCADNARLNGQTPEAHGCRSICAELAFPVSPTVGTRNYTIRVVPPATGDGYGGMSPVITDYQAQQAAATGQQLYTTAPNSQVVVIPVTKPVTPTSPAQEQVLKAVASPNQSIPPAGGNVAIPPAPTTADKMASGAVVANPTGGDGAGLGLGVDLTSIWEKNKLPILIGVAALAILVVGNRN